MREKAGYSLIEVLVALALFSVVALSLSVAVTTVVRASKTSERLTLATILAQDKLEELLARFAPLSSGTDTPHAGFTRVWDVMPDSPESGVVRVDVTVSWIDSQSHTISLATVINE